jgi:serine/threonine protein phosphatase PrpC
VDLMLCPSCREVLPEGAKFCEACGADVTDVVGVDPRTGAPAPPSAHSSSGCVSCGADAALIDADGYCGQCGFRQPRGRDHLEAELGVLAGVTDRGLRHHRNEDAMAMSLVDGVADALVAVVCDGVSTTQAPDVASQAAADAACAVLVDIVRTRPIALPVAIDEAAAAAQAAVLAVPFEAVASPADHGPPSCTLVCVVRLGARAFVGCIGDSRAYWLDGSGATALTVDDSWATEQVATGAMDIDTAMADPRAHTITRWLGADAPPPEARPKVFVIPGPGRLLLCSDGLWNYAEHATALAAKVAEQPPDIDAIGLARFLTDFAKQAGGHDNITVVVADVAAASLPAGDSPPPTTSPTGPPGPAPTEPRTERP